MILVVFHSFFVVIAMFVGVLCFSIIAYPSFICSPRWPRGVTAGRKHETTTATTATPTSAPASLSALSSSSPVSSSVFRISAFPCLSSSSFCFLFLPLHLLLLTPLLLSQFWRCCPPLIHSLPLFLFLPLLPHRLLPLHVFKNKIRQHHHQHQCQSAKPTRGRAHPPRFMVAGCSLLPGQALSTAALHSENHATQQVMIGNPRWAVKIGEGNECKKQRKKTNAIPRQRI